MSEPTETLGQMARRISDDQRRDKELQARDACLAKKKAAIDQCKSTLAATIADAANRGYRSINILDVSEGDVLFLPNSDTPVGVECEQLQSFLDYLTQQNLKAKVGCSKVGYGVYDYFVRIEW